MCLALPPLKPVQTPNTNRGHKKKLFCSSFASRAFLITEMVLIDSSVIL